MQAVILAAGLSRRLRPLTNEIPKCLLDVGDEILLSRYLRLLEAVGVAKTVVVAGFNSQAVKAEITSGKRTMEVECVVNHRFSDTHPIESFLLSENHIDDDFLILNADIYFTEPILRKLVVSANSAIAIDSSAPFESGEMYVNFESDMRVSAISKSLSERVNGQGKSVQIAKILQQDVAALFARAKDLAGGQNSFYPAQAYDILIDQGRFFAVDVAGEFFHEIDTVEDYESLKRQLQLPSKPR